MGYIVERNGRFTAYYRIGSRRLSAGTWQSKDQALASLSNAQSLVSDSPSRAYLTLNAYFDLWLGQAEVLPITLKGYESVIRRHILPILGHKRVGQINRKAIREALDSMKSKGASNSTIALAKASLGSMFAPLVESEEIVANPTHGIRIKKNQSDLRNVLEVEEFRKVVEQLPNESAKLFAKFLITSGCRYGEATELRVKDLNIKTKEIYVQRRVSDLGAKRNNGKRFLVVDSTKSGSKRVVTLSSALVAELKQHIMANSLEKDSLLFPKTLVVPTDKVEITSRQMSLRPFVIDGRNYKHGTLYAYTNGGCRCEECKNAFCEYRRNYRSKQQKRVTNDSGHLPRDVWRNTWNRAIAKSEIEWQPRTHDLRHANATALLKSGVDLHEVKERLGHHSIKTTERYLHRLRHQLSKASEVVNDFLE